MEKVMKVLITGMAGFIGSHLADYLIEQGHEVYGFDNYLTGSKENVNPKAHCGEVDVTKFKHVLAFMQNVKPDVVFHLAAIARTLWCIEDPFLAHETNATGTLNVLEAARRVGTVKKVVSASSNIVYAENTPYWATKLMGEHYCRVYNNLYGLPTVSLRFSNIYGSLRQSEKGPAINVLASLRKTKREKGYLEITGDGEQSRDFTHVLDLVEAIYLSAVKDVSGTELDICTGKNYTMNEVAKYFKCEVKYVPDRPGDIKHIVQDPSRVKELLGWEAKRKLEDNISIYVL